MRWIHFFAAVAMPFLLAAAPPVPIDHIDYVEWGSSASHWSAKLADDGKSFLRAPMGDWKRAQPQFTLNYLAPNGTEWTAQIQDGRFLNSANGAYVSFASSEMSYRGWDGAVYSIQLDLKNKRFLRTLIKAAPAGKPAHATRSSFL